MTYRTAPLRTGSNVLRLASRTSFSTAMLLAVSCLSGAVGGCSSPAGLGVGFAGGSPVAQSEGFSTVGLVPQVFRSVTESADNGVSASMVAQAPNKWSYAVVIKSNRSDCEKRINYGTQAVSLWDASLESKPNAVHIKDAIGLFRDTELLCQNPRWRAVARQRRLLAEQELARFLLPRKR